MVSISGVLLFGPSGSFIVSVCMGYVARRFL